jgi:hypothetical protein
MIKEFYRRELFRDSSGKHPRQIAIRVIAAAPVIVEIYREPVLAADVLQAL